jgi:hypothetical protein
MIVSKMVVSPGDEVFHFPWFTWVIASATIIEIFVLEYFINKITIKVV